MKKSLKFYLALSFLMLLGTALTAQNAVSGKSWNKNLDYKYKSAVI